LLELGRHRLGRVELGFLQQRLALAGELDDARFRRLGCREHGLERRRARAPVLGLARVTLEQQPVAPNGLGLGQLFGGEAALAGLLLSALVGGKRGRHNAQQRSVLGQQALLAVHAFADQPVRRDHSPGRVDASEDLAKGGGLCPGRGAGHQQQRRQATAGDS
jgi:hypothetical protein